MTPLEISLLSAFVPLVVALTAWLHAHTAVKTAADANANSNKALSLTRSAVPLPSNTPTEKTPDQAGSEQHPPL